MRRSSDHWENVNQIDKGAGVCGLSADLIIFNREKIFVGYLRKYGNDLRDII
jgi:hypothetical protein